MEHYERYYKVSGDYSGILCLLRGGWKHQHRADQSPGRASVEKRRNALKDCGLYERQSIKVLQYDLDNNFIQKFNSISEASEKTNTNRTSLSQCLNNKLKSANKFIWKRENN